MSIEHAELMGKRATLVPEESRTPVINALAVIYLEYEKLKKVEEVCEKYGTSL